jgi:flagellar hook-associated protein 1 FlgK
VITSATSADGHIQLRMVTNGTTSPLPATSGRLAGLVDVAASTANKRTAFEAVAQRLVDDVNAWSAQGIDANGNPGGALLSMAGGAVSLTVATSDPDAIAAASTGGVENGNLLQLPALRGSNGAEAGWAALVAANAQSLSSAKSEASAAATRRDGSLAARDEVSGIDLDKEAADLLRYQRAYDGSAKIIQVARDTVQAILDLF